MIGRGLLGKPRGKLVDLAVESGVRAPSKPPMMPLARHVPTTGKVLRMGGPPVDNVAIDEEGQITLVRLVGFSVLIGLGLGYLCLPPRQRHPDGLPGRGNQRGGQPLDRLVEWQQCRRHV